MAHQMFFFALEAALLVVAIWQMARLVERPVGGARDYFFFAAPALLLLSFVVSLVLSSAAALRRARADGSLEALMSTAVTPTGLGLGLAMFPAESMLLRLFFAYCLAALLGVAPRGWEVPAALVTVILSFAIALCVALLAEAASLLGRRIFAAALLLLFCGVALSGALFPLAALPPAVHVASELLPFRAMADAMRLSYSGAPGASLTQSWAALVLWLALLAPVSWLAMEGAFRRVRRHGSL